MKVGDKFLIKDNDDDEGQDIIYTITSIDDWVEYKISGTIMDDSFKRIRVEQLFNRGDWVLYENR